MGSIASQDKVDRDGDGISEYAGYQRANFSGTARLELDTRTDMLVRLSYAQETRQGGGMGSFLEAINDFDPEEETGRRAISESIITDRIEAGARLSRVVNLRLRTETSLGLVQHDQDSDYAGEVYTARQHMLFVQQNAFVEAHDRYRVVSGASYRYEGLDENLALQEYHYHMPGFFAQGEYRPADWVEFIHGLRYDWHNIFGSVVTPRLALKVAPHQHLTLRTSLGTGFRAPTTFFEYIHGVRPEGYRLVNESVKPEESVGGNVSATLDAGPMARLTISGAYNRIANPITLDMLTDDDDEVYEVRVVNASEDLTVMSGEVQLQSNPTPWLRTALGYGLFHYDDPGEALLSAPPRQQFNVAMDAELRRLGLILSFNGELFSPMDLEGVYGEGYNARPGTALAGWLDESNADLDNPKRARSPWYGVLNVRAEKLLLGGLSAHVGVDNLLDYHQSDVEGPVFFSMGDDGRLEPADVAYVWGPLRGRFIYGGMKAKL